jgi:MGT family glycosyltransferase
MHVCAALWDGGGTVPVEMGVVQRLVTRGHTVTVLGDPTMERDAVAAGAGFRPWRDAPHRRSATDRGPADDTACRTPLQLLHHLQDGLITGPAGAFAAEVREELHRSPADVVLANGFLLGALVGAESCGVPAVVLCSNAYTRPAPGAPPFGAGLAPLAGPLGRVRDGAVNAVLTRLWKRGLRALDAARAELGLDPLTEPWAQWDRAARVLVLTSRAFDDLPTRLPANVRYVGPVLDDPVWSTPVPVPDGEGPLVAVGLSSTWQAQEDALRRIVAALESLPVRAVVTTGPMVDPAAVPGSDRVAVVRSAPHTELFARADVVVTHAGHGTLMKALSAGVPVLCLPMGRDQGDNVVRARRQGAALALRPSASPERIAAAVATLLEDPSYRRAAETLGARIQAEVADSRLVEEVERAARRTAAA